MREEEEKLLEGNGREERRGKDGPEPVKAINGSQTGK